MAWNEEQREAWAESERIDAELRRRFPPHPTAENLLEAELAVASVAVGTCVLLSGLLGYVLVKTAELKIRKLIGQ